MEFGMDKRQYLRSLGFTVGERGRFTAEMITALKEYQEEGGKLEGRTGKRDDGLPEVEPSIIIPDIPPQEQIRQPKTLIGKSPEGYKIAFVMCFECHYHMMYCNCEGGVKAPSSVVSSKDPLVRV
jgi:hypothetical protein